MEINRIVDAVYDCAYFVDSTIKRAVIDQSTVQSKNGCRGWCLPVPALVRRGCPRERGGGAHRLIRSASRPFIRCALRAIFEQTAPPSLREGTPPNLGGECQTRCTSHPLTLRLRVHSVLDKLVIDRAYNTLLRGRGNRADALCEPGLVALCGIPLHHALLDRSINDAECFRQKGLRVRASPDVITARSFFICGFSRCRFI